MADPFAQTPAAGVAPAPLPVQSGNLAGGQMPAPLPTQSAPQSGFLGMSPSFWQNLQNFGANMSVAANARDSNGFLTYGNGFAGPLGEAAIATQKQARDAASAMSAQQLNYAEAQQTQSQTQINQLQVPLLQARIKILNQMAQDSGYPDGMPPALSDTSDKTPGSDGAGPLGDVVSTIETGGKQNPYQAVNSAGYAGKYQFGAAELAAAGLYTPAKGEDPNANSWQGTLNIPGFGQMSFSQFMATPKAQDAAFSVGTAYNWQGLKQAGADQYIGENIGGVPITQASLLAGAWAGGINGVSKFISTGGKYNPADSNGVTIGAYMSKAEQLMAQNGMPDTGVGGMPTVATGGAPGMPPQPQDAVATGQPPQAEPIPLAPASPPAAQPIQAQVAPAPQGASAIAAPYAGAVPAPAPPMPPAAPDGGQVDPHFMLPQGVPTLAQDQQLAQYFSNRARMEGAVGGMDGAATADNAQASYYQGLVKQAMAPQTLRGPGAVGFVPGVGYTSAPIHTSLFDQNGNPLPAVSNPGFNFNGQNLQAPNVELVPQPGVSASGQNAPRYISPNADGKGGVYAPGDKVTSNAFDASLLGLPYQGATQTSQQPYTTELPVGLETNLKEAWDDANEYQKDLNGYADGAVGQNTTLQAMRMESRTWTPNLLAPTVNDANKTLLTIAQTFGINDPGLAAKVGDYGAFMKNAGLLTQDQVRKVSGRASTQEYMMVGNAMPNPTIGGNGLEQIWDELQGVNDYTLGKQAAYGKWKSSIQSLPPGEQLSQLNQSFDAQFNQRIRPMAFIIHRMSMTPDGQQIIATMTHNLQQTPEGRAELKSLNSQIAYGMQAGLFNAPDGGP